MPKKRNTGLPKIYRLPSGNWTAKLYDYTDATGKKHFTSFTHPEYDRVVLEMARLKADRKANRAAEARGEQRLTLGAAMEQYIDSKSAVLSPSTVRSYRGLARNYLKDLHDTCISDLTREQVQIAINREALSHSPKTVRNIHGFLTSVLQIHRPDFVLHTTLPQKVKPQIHIPTEEEIKRLFEVTKDTDMEIPVLLASCCGMRRSEIAALTWKHIDFKQGTIRIERALVLGDDRQFVEKTTKTTAGTRTVRMFPIVADVLQKYRKTATDDDTYITIRPDLISNRFYNLIRREGFPEYRFHDLRHYTVSVMLSLNIPKNYIADYVGHETENMIDQVYGHIMASKKTSVEDQLQAYFQNALGTGGAD